jgi:ribonuclease HI
MSYYAVAKGKHVGIFLSWVECEKVIKGKTKAIFKKFDNFQEAENFVRGNIDDPDQLHSDDSSDEEVMPDYFVYTDGSCINNGKEDACAGIGIYFGENDPRNVSSLIQGKQTNNIAELTAIFETYPLIENDLLQGKKITIVSDSLYAIRCVTTYGKKCEQKNWEEEIPNKELVRQVYELYKPLTLVSFRYVKAHTDLTDCHSVGNSQADKLANQSMGMSSCPNATTASAQQTDNQKIYLQVQFTQKDQIKSLGGRWDVGRKKWYILDSNPKKQMVLDLFTQVD